MSIDDTILREFTIFTKRAMLDSGGGSLHTTTGAPVAPQSQATLPVRQATLGNSPPVVSDTPQTATGGAAPGAASPVKPLTPPGKQLKTTNWSKP
jgi:hypothetical protein